MTITPEQLRAYYGDSGWVEIESEDCSMLADAIEIADLSSDAYLYSTLRPLDDDWLDLATELTEDERESIDQAVRYLTARGLLERHPEREQWVRVREVAEVPA